MCHARFPSACTETNGGEELRAEGKQEILKRRQRLERLTSIARLPRRAANVACASPTDMRDAICLRERLAPARRRPDVLLCACGPDGRRADVPCASTAGRVL